MERRIHEGILYQDQHKRYCLYEPDMPPYKRLTCTSGCRLEVWLNRTWIAGHVEGDGEDYWLFAEKGGRFLLAEHMKARYTEHHSRSGIRNITGSCSSSFIRLMGKNPCRNRHKIAISQMHRNRLMPMEPPILCQRNPGPMSATDTVVTENMCGNGLAVFFRRKDIWTLHILKEEPF